eukprot:CAMPEP_0198609446 /NCGR_PEP_ID=MMETSP1462-20131121/156398_1 /TAXON_ID=1333877 /ORGANISM="Brandtodinium nutriculum, Strain RCC3387" /LENGTH=177 /DNA_ID=CAMNT_0044341251 /DNA_START=1315 /DNA_END=1844 /DNA_ORIENTATION=+
MPQRQRALGHALCQIRRDVGLKRIDVQFDGLDMCWPRLLRSAGNTEDAFVTWGPRSAEGLSGLHNALVVDTFPSYDEAALPTIHVRCLGQVWLRLNSDHPSAQRKHVRRHRAHVRTHVKRQALPVKARDQKRCGSFAYEPLWVGRLVRRTPDRPTNSLICARPNTLYIRRMGAASPT